MLGLDSFATFRDWSAKLPFLRTRYARHKFGFAESSTIAARTGGREVRTL